MAPVKQKIAFLQLSTPRTTWKHAFREALLLSAYTFLFLLLFQPFGTFEFRHPHKTLLLSGYSLILLVFYPPFRILLRTLLIRGQPVYSLTYEILLMFCTLMLLTIISFFYHGRFIKGELHLAHFPAFMQYGFLFWLLPGLGFIYLRWRLLREEKNQLSLKTEDDTIKISGLNQDEDFLFAFRDIYYLKSNGNYVQVYYQKNGQLKYEMLRNTLGQVGGQLPAGDFISIHRSFIVNPKNFDQLLKTDGKLLLINRRYDLHLPVARPFASLLEQKLKDRR